MNEKSPIQADRLHQALSTYLSHCLSCKNSRALCSHKKTRLRPTPCMRMNHTRPRLLHNNPLRHRPRCRYLRRTTSRSHHHQDQASSHQGTHTRTSSDGSPDRHSSQSPRSQRADPRTPERWRNMSQAPIAYHHRRRTHRSAPHCQIHQEAPRHLRQQQPAMRPRHHPLPQLSALMAHRTTRDTHPSPSPHQQTCTRGPRPCPSHPAQNLRRTESYRR